MPPKVRQTFGGISIAGALEFLCVHRLLWHVLNWSVMTVYILMCADEIVKLFLLYPRYRKYSWINNLTRDGNTD